MKTSFKDVIAVSAVIMLLSASMVVPAALATDGGRMGTWHRGGWGGGWHNPWWGGWGGGWWDPGWGNWGGGWFSGCYSRCISMGYGSTYCSQICPV